MKVIFVSAKSFSKNLERLFLNCKALDIAVAFVKSGGLNPFLKILIHSCLMNKKLPIRIVFGLSSKQGITDKKSATKLLKLANENENIEVKKYNNQGFHPKLMIFHGEPCRILLGSSNLTGAAQGKNIEANVIIENPKKDFVKDVNDFFNECFIHGKSLEQSHINSYIQWSHEKSRDTSTHFPEDKLPKNLIIVSTSSNIGKITSKPIKSKKYYDEKIRALDNRKRLTPEQKMSLRAYRALRTRYYGKKSGTRVELDILLPVMYGINHLEEIVTNGKGEWTIGKKVEFLDSVVGGNAFFYENKKKITRYYGRIEKIWHENNLTKLQLSNLNRLKKRKKLNNFKKRNGESVKFLGCFVYLPRM